MSLVDESIELAGKTVTLNTITLGVASTSYGDRAKSAATSTIYIIMGPWGVVRSYATQFNRPGMWTDAEMWGIIKSTVTATKNRDIIDDGSDKWDIEEVYEIELFGDTQAYLLKLAKRND